MSASESGDGGGGTVVQTRRNRERSCAAKALRPEVDPRDGACHPLSFAGAAWWEASLRPLCVVFFSLFGRACGASGGIPTDDEGNANNDPPPPPPFAGAPRPSRSPAVPLLSPHTDDQEENDESTYPSRRSPSVSSVVASSSSSRGRPEGRPAMTASLSAQHWATCWGLKYGTPAGLYTPNTVEEDPPCASSSSSSPSVATSRVRFRAVANLSVALFPFACADEGAEKNASALRRHQNGEDACSTRTGKEEVEVVKARPAAPKTVEGTPNREEETPRCRKALVLPMEKNIYIYIYIN